MERLVFETENEFLRLRITEPTADHLFDVDRIIPEAFENFFLLLQLRFCFRQPSAAGSLLQLEPVKFFPRLKEIDARRRAHRQKEEKVNGDNDTAEIHEMGTKSTGYEFPHANLFSSGRAWK